MKNRLREFGGLVALTIMAVVLAVGAILADTANPPVILPLTGFAGTTNPPSIVVYPGTSQTGAPGQVTGLSLLQSAVTIPPGPVPAITLNWTGTSNAVIYMVSRGLASGAEAPYAAVASTSFADTNVIPATNYFYTVAAWGSVANGASSAETVTNAPYVPGPITITSASETTTNTIQIQWSPGAHATNGYIILRATTSRAETNYAWVSASTNAFTDTNVSVQVGYYYEVAGTNGIAVGPPSSENLATIFVH